MWQSMISNTAPNTSGNDQSVWRAGGVLETKTVQAVGDTVHASNTNFGDPTKAFMYIVQDDLVFKGVDFVINSATVDLDLDGIATTTWSGQGTDLVRMTGAAKSKVLSVIANTSSDNTYASGHCSSWNTHNVYNDTSVYDLTQVQKQTKLY